MTQIEKADATVFFLFDSVGLTIDDNTSPVGLECRRFVGGKNSEGFLSAMVFNVNGRQVYPVDRKPIINT
jgi:hypothetical protein